MSNSKLREGPFSFSDLLDATSRGGHMRIGFDGVNVKRICLQCDAEFEQTEDGFAALREHELQHGAGQPVDLSELDGKTLRIVTWTAASRRFLSRHYTPEIWAVDEASGIVYCLSNAYQNEHVWKWKINSSHSGVLALLNGAMPPDQDSRSADSAHSGAPCDRAAAMATTAKDC